ncbi:hypothetical protein AX768_23070 [Burkholderia sp. PAMC 28687]|nr:hypothetical protein AX768_23070 [Burkholderia sp. PAMC 28687]
MKSDGLRSAGLMAAHATGALIGGMRDAEFLEQTLCHAAWFFPKPRESVRYATHKRTRYAGQKTDI